MAPAHLTTDLSARLAESLIRDGFAPCSTAIVVLTHTAAGPATLRYPERGG